MTYHEPWPPTLTVDGGILKLAPEDVVCITRKARTLFLNLQDDRITSDCLRSWLDLLSVHEILQLITKALPELSSVECVELNMVCLSLTL